MGTPPQPSDNVELVRAIVADWERGDYSAAEWAHAEIEFVRADGPEPGTWRGLAGLAEGTRYRLNAWNDFRLQGSEYRELDEGRVVVLGDATARGKRSGLGVRQAHAIVFEIREGKVVKLVTYIDQARALAELGLPQ